MSIQERNYAKVLGIERQRTGFSLKRAWERFKAVNNPQQKPRTELPGLYAGYIPAPKK